MNLSRQIKLSIRAALPCLTACLLLAAASVTVGDEVDPLAEAGISVTGGAAPGYVPDETCGRCHDEISESYREVAMARSFYRPSTGPVIENFDNARVVHEASRRFYEMRLEDGNYLFRRYQLDPDGKPVNEFEVKVDWILGSGNHSRTYLYRTDSGEMYQLPIAWYTQTGKWAMAPGFEFPVHQGIARLVRRECFFCHDAYPDVSAGSDEHWAPHLFPAELPEGIGCQRCHGPGAEHVRVALGDNRDEARLREAIVNPARLSRERRRDICYGCHMQPSIALFGVRRFDRADYSFRPGEALADYMVKMDVTEEDRPRAERFEINHHPYRLEQSRCFSASGEALECVTCHDPHRAVPSAERAAHFRAACQTCHDGLGCSRPAGAGGVRQEKADLSDCVSCHMAKRRTQDVVEVVMTDHLIRRRPGGPELLAPLKQEPHTLIDARPLDTKRLPPAPWPDIYRAVAVLRAGPSSDALEFLERAWSGSVPPYLALGLDLGRAQLKAGRTAQASITMRKVLARWPDSGLAHELLGLSLARLGRGEEAKSFLRTAAELVPERPEVHFNLGRLLLTAGRVEEALPRLQEAARLRPPMAAAHLQLGGAHERLEDLDEAEKTMRRALAVEPSFTEAYLALARVLVAQEKLAEARRVLRHGAEIAADPEPVREALEGLGSE